MHWYRVDCYRCCWCSCRIAWWMWLIARHFSRSRMTMRNYQPKWDCWTDSAVRLLNSQLHNFLFLHNFPPFFTIQITFRNGSEKKSLMTTSNVLAVADCDWHSFSYISIHENCQTIFHVFLATFCTVWTFFFLHVRIVRRFMPYFAQLEQEKEIFLCYPCPPPSHLNISTLYRVEKNKKERKWGKRLLMQK